MGRRGRLVAVVGVRSDIVETIRDRVTMEVLQEAAEADLQDAGIDAEKASTDDWQAQGRDTPGRERGGEASVGTGIKVAASDEDVSFRSVRQ